MFKRIGVLTSGGDAPGMNAAIRAVVRAGLAQGWEVWGIRRGYAGLLAGEARPLGARDVGGIIQLGGTILGSARCPEFKTPEGPKKAVEVLDRLGIEALVVIGWGSDITLGVDTALNVALEAIDRLKTTASSHNRAFLVEVMGRDCGYLALMAGIAGGAEAVVIPEVPISPESVAEAIREAYSRGKPHAIVVVAEGAEYNAQRLAEYFQRENLGYELRVTVLGHVQRGGAPGAFDRLLGTRLGVGAVEALARGEHGVLVGQIKGEIVTTPLSEVVGKKKPIDPRLFELAKVLAQ